MATLTREQVESFLGAFRAKDLDAVLSFFADDAVVYDPHYPVPEMKGKAAIRQGIAWSFANVEQPGFTIRHLWLAPEVGAMEVDTHHFIVPASTSALRASRLSAE